MRRAIKEKKPENLEVVEEGDWKRAERKRENREIKEKVRNVREGEQI